ncbi:MAG TPA: amidohydrolase family protein [Steroidobacteraceae bacterium]|nr:amidohydrolase family protein [Steroidobacteraceae bacterium]
MVNANNTRARQLQLALVAAALASALLLAVAVPARAADAGTETIALKAAHLFDSTGSALKNGAVILVQGDHIVSVGTSVPTGARVIDLGDATLLPGFIDAHTHLTMELEKDYYHYVYNRVMRFPAEQALYGALYARRTLEAGFTTVRNVGAYDFVDIGLRNAINAGVTEGPRMLTAAHGIGSPGGHFDDYPFPPERVKPDGPIEGICSGPEQCREAVRYQMKWGADLIKIAASGGVLSESDPVDVPQLTPEELAAIISEAHKWNRKVAAHCHGDAAARLAIAAGVDSIEHGSFLTEDTLKIMKAKGVWLVPTRMAVYWVSKEADHYPPKIAAKARAAAAAHDKMFRTALRLGVPIAFGTDAGVYPHGMNAMEFGLMTALGMKPAAALLAGTRDAAKLLGVEGEVGTLEAGKVADIVAVPGNVLSDIHATEHPVFVMHLGHIVLQKAGT